MCIKRSDASRKALSLYSTHFQANSPSSQLSSSSPCNSSLLPFFSLRWLSPTQWPYARLNPPLMKSRSSVLNPLAMAVHRALFPAPSLQIAPYVAHLAVSETDSHTYSNQVVTFGFDAFQTYIGPTAKQADKTKQCQIHLSLQYPGGFQYSVVDATYHGWARLDPGVTGTFVSSYFFSQAASQTCTTRSTISGSQWVDGDVYTKQDLIESTAVIVSDSSFISHHLETLKNQHTIATTC